MQASVQERFMDVLGDTLQLQDDRKNAQFGIAK
jgi:hypothetical protein